MKDRFRRPLRVRGRHERHQHRGSGQEDSGSCCHGRVTRLQDWFLVPDTGRARVQRRSAGIGLRSCPKYGIGTLLAGSADNPVACGTVQQGSALMCRFGPRSAQDDVE
jgi:hypothetical protein